MQPILDKFNELDSHNLLVVSVKNRLLSKTRIDENGCWIWTGALDNYGYGLMGLKFPEKYKLVAVHRLSAHLFLGLNFNQSIIRALHKESCHRRNCWNPDHIYLGTQQENVWDAIKRRTHRNVRDKKI